ncbi:MAG: hypothetical protein M3Z75_05100 [Actinomycetota bacterium]|nr:hypothetical protein [Actinomycetota bacterium]
MNENYSHEGPLPEDPGGSPPPGGYGGAGSPPVIGVSRAVAPPEQNVSLPPTGDDRVDGAVAGLSRLPGLPAAEHVTVLEEVHGRLRDILGELSEGNSGPGRPDRGESRP